MCMDRKRKKIKDRHQVFWNTTGNNPQFSVMPPGDGHYHWSLVTHWAILLKTPREGTQEGQEAPFGEKMRPPYDCRAGKDKGSEEETILSLFKKGFHSHLDSNSQVSFPKSCILSPVTWHHQNLQCLLSPFLIFTTKPNRCLDRASWGHISDCRHYASQSAQSITKSSIHSYERSSRARLWK